MFGMFTLVLIGLGLALFALTLVSQSAPVGFQDEGGFHYGEGADAEEQERWSPGTRARR